MQEDSHGFITALKTHWRSLEQKQKAFFAVFVLFSCMALVFSYISVKEGINAPFRVSVKEAYKNVGLLKDQTEEQESLAKRIDSDGDGLSDWDEQNVYKSSPYLWSTAGDGVPDNIKVAMGENPLCKLGEPCTAQAMKFDLPTGSFPLMEMSDQPNVNEQLSDILMGENQVGENFRGAADEAGVEYNLDTIPRDPALLRQALMQTGRVDQEKLDSLSDEQLLQFFDEAKAEIIADNPALNSATGTKQN